MADAKQPTTLRLNQAGLDAARTRLDDGAVTPAWGTWRDDIVAQIGDKDSTTRRLLEDILADEEEHADELKDWMARA